MLRKIINDESCKLLMKQRDTALHKYRSGTKSDDYGIYISYIIRGPDNNPG